MVRITRVEVHLEPTDHTIVVTAHIQVDGVGRVTSAKLPLGSDVGKAIEGLVEEAKAQSAPPARPN
jgi:hypothetical protein